MTTSAIYVLEKTTNQADFDYCALMMAKSDPWITLEMGFDLCSQAFKGVAKEVFVIKIIDLSV